MSLALVILAAAPAVAATQAAFADLSVLDRAVEAFTGAPAGAVGGAQARLDRRMKLRACSGAPSLSWRSDTRDAVVVACGDAGSWRLYVPVLRAPAPVAAAPAVMRGDAVAIAIAGEGFSVSQPGEALDQGAAGDWIRVRPAAAARNADPMRGRIERPGLVVVPLP